MQCHEREKIKGMIERDRKQEIERGREKIEGMIERDRKQE